MVRLNERTIEAWLFVSDIPLLARIALNDIKEYRTLLADLHTRMIDVYDGAPDSTNYLPFTGGDIRDIEEVLR